MKKVLLLVFVVIVVQILSLNIFARNVKDIYVYDGECEYLILSKDSGFVTMLSNGKYTIVDGYNQQYYQLDCDGMGRMSEGFVSIYDSSSRTITFTTLNGYSFVVESVRRSGEFLGGKCSVTSVDGAYGLIDTTGHYLLECEYENIIYDTSDTFLVCKDNVWKLATLKNGKVSLETFVKSNVVRPVKDSTMKNIIASDGQYYGIISAENKLLVEFKYDYVYDLTGGMYAGIRGETTDLITSEGKVTATLDTTAWGKFSEGKIPCYMDGKFCYIDKNGTVVTEVAVTDVRSIDSYYEGLAVVQMNDGSYSFITENGELATRYMWDYAARFARGYALVMDIVESNTVVGEYVRSWKIIDHNFNTVEQLDVDVYVNEAEEHTTDFSNGFIRTIDNKTGKMGFVYTENTYSEDPDNGGTDEPDSSFVYEILNGKVTITGVTEDFVGGNVVIPNTLGGYPVVAIGDEALYGCSNITSITLPDSITSIGNAAFGRCENLTSITIPDSVTNIGDYAFCLCTSLTSITIPNSVTSIGEGVFIGCYNFIIYCYEGSAAHTYVIKNTLSYALLDGTDDPEGNIEFYYSRVDDGVVITGVVDTSISGDIVIPDTLGGYPIVAIGDNALYGCSNITSITLPDSVTSIGAFAFYWCRSLTNAIIPNSVTEIGSYAFFYCSSLESITIPEGITNISDRTFAYCSNLTSITIPESVKIFDDNAFTSCTNLAYVYYGGSESQWKTISIGIDNQWLTNATIHFTDETVETIPGDANGDGSVDAADLQLLQRYIAGLSAEMDETVADANGDGNIDAADTMIISRTIAGLSV